MRKWIIIAVVVLLALPLIAVGAAAAWLATADLKPILERKLSANLERPVTIGSLKVAWGDPLGLDITDLAIANAAWAKPEQMITLAHVYARIDLRPLLHGVVRYQRLDIDKLVVVLERDQQGIGNWKFGDAAKTGASAPAGSGPALVPKNRQQFPTVLDLTMTGTQVRYRTSTGHWLTIDLDNVAVNTTDDDQPITVTATGAYNKIPAKLQAGGDSFIKLRDAETPYGTTFSVTNDTIAVNFHGTMMDPLDFDGVKGPMTIDTKKLGDFLKVFDAEMTANLPLTIDGAFTRTGDHWALDQAKGALADNAFTGALALDEGPRGGTDHMSLDLDFDRLLLDSVMDRMGSSGPSDPSKSKLDLPGKGSPEFKAKLSARRFQFGKITLPKLKLAGAAGPGHIEVQELRFGFAGATLHAKAAAKQDGDQTAVNLTADLLGANITDLLKTFDAGTNDISGKVDARATLAGTGTTVDQLLATGRGEAVMAMREGKVAKDVLEKASTDLRTIFRKGEGMSRVDCLLAVAKIENGVATLAPLALRSPDAQLVGAGKLDLKSHRLDLMFKSNPKSTGFFALDIPIQVSGPLTSLSAKPAAKSNLETPTMPTLSPAALQLAQQSGCTS